MAGTDLRIVVVDPRDEEMLKAWHEVYLVAERHERPYATPFLYAEYRAALLAPPVSVRRHILAGLVDGKPVSIAGAELPLLDNLTSAEVHVQTLPTHRRQGHATRVLGELERLLRAEGRARLTALQDFAYERGPSGAGDGGVELLQRLGYVNALGDVKRRLSLPVRSELLGTLATEAAPHHTAYTLRQFVHSCPDDLLDSFARLLGKLMTQAPMGDLELEDEHYDAERIRHDEQVSRESDRTGYYTVAVDERGEVVAYTQLMVAHHDPGRAFQWGTLVDPAHRGHRLGMAVKVANLALLQREEPGLEEVVTYNAEVNPHMVEVNDRLGFVPVARCGEFQKLLA